MSAEFSQLCKRLTIAAAVAVLLPMGTAVLLSGTQAAADTTTTADAFDIVPAPQHSASLDMLGRARAVSWISSGHIAR